MALDGGFLHIGAGIDQAAKAEQANGKGNGAMGNGHGIEEGQQPRQAVKHPHEQQGKDKANRADALWKHQAASLREEPLFQ